MRVVICGAGQVGYGIAERLAAEDNDVSVIDTSPRLIQAISESLDVRALVGHGAYPDVLAQAGAEQADMLIAVTLHDEVNMVACQVAHALFNVPTKIARIRAQTYLAPHWRHLFAQENLPIDVVISPEIEVGEMVLRRLASSAWSARRIVRSSIRRCGSSPVCSPIFALSSSGSTGQGRRSFRAARIR
jgi:trk system potassium uptake protein TrkA